jgi:diguanylate cyclase (GGDEF)-like protein
MSSTITAQARRLPRFSFGGTPAIWLYNVALLATGAGIWVTVLRGMSPAPAASLGVPWWGVALVFYLAESYVVHVHFRREAHTLSLNEIALVAGLFLLSPGSLLLAQVVGGGAALVFHRRQRLVKLAFNIAQFTVTTAVALLVFRSVCQLGHPFGLAGWGAAILATVAASLLGIVLVTLVIAIAQHELLIAQLPMTTAISVTATIATSSLALVAIELTRVDPRAFLLLVAPGAIVVFAFRALMEQRRRHEHLEFLYESMQRTQGEPEFGLAVGQLLIAVRRLVRAEYAEIILFPTDSDQGLRSTLGVNGEMLMQPGDITTTDRLLLALAENGEQTLVVPSPRTEHPLDDYLGERKLPDAMISVLRTEDGPFGLLLVGDRAGDVDTFGREDATLLETFGRHASVLIENGRLERSLAEVTELKDELRHQAFHDTLTGLPNRALFAEQVKASTAVPSVDGLAPAVLFLDLDEFKTVNDSRGHSVGDELLVEVGRRIRLCLRPGDTPARLGGDEFGMLLGPTTSAGAETVAERVLATLAKPFNLQGRELYVHASIGIALASPGQSTEELLLNADVAMYAAKAAGKGRFAHYQAGLHARVKQRHELALDLERAVERDEIDTVFQPIVSLRTGRVVSFEALARWQHPKRGLVMPDDFISVAEEIGVMPTIGGEVLRQAVRAAKAWQEAHTEDGDIGVAVNLSPSQLGNERLADEIARMLLEARLDSGLVTFEITESAAMRDIDVALARMFELRNLGVKLALDDFGTGHSSLARLDTLPLNILKIAKPFVDRLLDARPDTSFVDAFVRLAYSLDMECVAEGIEVEAQVPRLLDRGCGLGQGFFFAQPMAVDEIRDYLASTRPVRIDL